MNLRFLSGFLFLVCVLAVEAGAGILHGPVINPANGHAYYLLEADTWQNSVRQAYALGGHLVVINDQAENEWVASTFGRFGGVARNLWLGLSDVVKEGTFEWGNRDPMSFTRWKAGEPDNTQEGKNYAFLVAPVEGQTGGEWAISIDAGDGGAILFHGVVETDHLEHESAAEWSWDYGWRVGASGEFQRFNTPSGSWFLVLSDRSRATPNVRLNRSTTPAGTPILQPYEFVMEPGSGGEYAESIWTAPMSGTFVVEATFLDLDPAGDGQDVHVLVDGTEVFNAVINAADGSGRATYTSPAPMSLTRDKTVVFRVGAGGAGHDAQGDSTRVDAVVRYPGAKVTYQNSGAADGVRIDDAGNTVVSFRTNDSQRGELIYDANGSLLSKGPGKEPLRDKDGNYARFENGKVSKYRGIDGGLLWERAFTGLSLSGMKFDREGNIVAAGDAADPQGGTDFYLVKYASKDGTVLWEKRVDGKGADVSSARSQSDRMRGLALDAEGNVLIVGSYDAVVPTPKYPSGTIIDACVEKHAADDGRLLWRNLFTSFFWGSVRSLATDSKGDAVIFGGDLSSMYVWKHSGSTGLPIWKINRANPYGFLPYGLRASSIGGGGCFFDAHDNIVVTASVVGVPSGVDHDLYAAKYDGVKGIGIWERRWRKQGSEFWGGTAVDTGGNIVIAGTGGIIRYEAPLIDDQYAEFVGHTGAVLHGLVRFSDSTAKVHFEYGTDTSYGMRTQEVPLPEDGLVSAAISGLSTPNTYHFRLVAQTTQGLLFGEDQVFDMKTVPNLEPVAQSDFYADPVPAGSSELVIDVLANDSDPDGDQLQIKSVSQGQYGAVSINEGKVIYRPAANLVVDSFNYTITDAYGGTALGWVEVGRYGVNATAAIDDFTQVVSGVSSAINVLANDSAPGGKPLSITSYTQGQHGTVTQGSTGRLYYMSTSGFAGDDQFTYTISDGLLSASATVRVTVSKPPVAVDDSGSTSSGLLEIDVLANDSDPGGKPLTIIGYTQPAHGAVEASTGEMLRYSPYPDFRGDDQFTYTISNGALTAQATVRVSVSAWPAAGNILAGSGTEVPGAGEAGGVPVGASFRSFGVPSINDQEKVAFTATFAAGKQSGSAVFAGSPLGLIAGKGSPAPDAVGQPLAKGEIFSSFRDPLLNARGDVAFLARISRATQRSDSGLWLKPAEGSLHMVLREGDAAAGVNGSRWSTFVSVGLTDSRVIPFVATLQVGKGGVTPANALGLWTWKEGEAKLLLRKGDRISVGEKQKQVKSFAALAPAKGSPGQGRLGTGEEVLVRVSWSDRTQSLVKVAPGIAPEVIASTGDKVTGTEMRFASFGIPSPDRQGGFAVRATLQPRSGGVKASSDTGVFKYAPDTGWTIIVQEGESRPDDPLEEYGQRMIPFYAITEAVSDAQGRVALLAAGGRGSSWPFDLWWTASAGLSLAHTWWGNATWTGPIVSFAYPDGENASLVYLVDAPNGTGKKAKREIGLWALDQDGLSRLLCKSGQTVSISGVTKTIRDLDFLELVPGSPAQPRSYNSKGQIICRLIFTDGSQAVLKGSVR